MADHSAMKLGKRAPRIDPRTLQLGKYIADLTVPGPTDWSQDVPDWGMMANDRLGDCTIAGCGHAVQTACLNTTGMMTIADDEIIKFYELWCGYNPADPSTDQGGVEIDVLNSWRKKLKFVGHELMAYAALDPGSDLHVRQSVALFGGVYIGLGLPITAQSQDIWDVVGDPQSDPDSQPYSWGGHCVYVLGFDDTHLKCVTWGGLKQMTWAFWKGYCDEAYGLLLGYWFENKMLAPSGFDPSQLLADVALLNAQG